MSDYTNDFSAWQNGSPVILVGGNPDFSIWFQGAPIISRDEGGPLATLSGTGAGAGAGSGAAELLGLRTGTGAGAGAGTGALTSIAFVSGRGAGTGAGTGTLRGFVLIAGRGAGAGAGTGTLGGVTPAVVLHRRVSPVQPRLRHFDPASDKWWSRRVSPKSERQRIPN